MSVHTPVTHSARAPRSARKARTVASFMQSTVPMMPPGTNSTSGFDNASSNVCVGVIGRPTSVDTGCRSFQTSSVRQRRILKTVIGPTRSSATMFG